MPQGSWELHVEQLSLPRLTLTNVTLTCDPFAPSEPPEPIALDISDGHQHRHAWRLLSDLQLPARLLLTRNISLEGVPPWGLPTPVVTRDVWVGTAPELQSAGQQLMIDYAFNYEPVLVASTAQVSAQAHMV